MPTSARTTAVAGNFITYAITVSNNGPSDGTSATLSDTLSGQLQSATFCSYTGATACDPAAAAALSWSGSTSLGALAAGASKSTLFPYTTLFRSTVASIANAASLGSQSPSDPISGND